MIFVVFITYYYGDFNKCPETKTMCNKRLWLQIRPIDSFLHIFT